MPITVKTHPLAHRPRRGPIAIPVVLAASLVALMLVLVTPPTPTADRVTRGDILVSLDGANWSTTLPFGLFSGVGTVVPGDSLSRTLWIENTSSSPALLRLSRVENAGTRSSLSRAISLTATARGASGPRVPAANGSCAQLLPDALVDAGKSISIVVTLSIADLMADEAQGQSAVISLLASMDTHGHTAASPCSGGGTNVPVLDTAQSVDKSDRSPVFSAAGLLYPAIMSASLLTGVALFTHFAARRRRHAE